MACRLARIRNIRNRNHGISLWLEDSSVFLRQDTGRNKCKRKIIENLEFIKILKFYSSKDTIKENE